MAITTLDGAIAGMQPPTLISKSLSGTLVAGRPHSMMYLSGMPAAAAAPTPGLAGAALTSYAGQIPFSNPVSGNTYLARMTATSSAQPGMLLLCDRLWHNSGFTITLNTAQTVNSATWPARDNDGATSGAGVLLGLEISATTGAGTPTITVSYTDSNGNAGRTGTNIDATAATVSAGSFFRLGFGSGHSGSGVRSVQSLTLSATWTSGTMHLVAYRVLAAVEISAGGVTNAIDALTGGFPRMYDNTVPFLLFIPQTTTTTGLSSVISYTQG